MANKFNIYNLFNPAKDGKGVKKEPDAPRNLQYFFKLYSRNFGRLMTVNAFIVFGNFPFLFFLFANAGFVDRHGIAPASKLFAPLYSAMIQNGAGSPVTAALYSIHGVQAQISIPTPATQFFYILSGLIIITFGLVSAGVTYVLRNMVKGEPVSVWADFWYSVKKNWKQGLVLGIIDAALLGLFAYNIIFYYYNLGQFFNNVMFYFCLFMLILYFMMRFYLYLMSITFNLSIFKIYKNALIFSMLGFKRNITAILGIAFLIFVNYALFLMFVPIGIIIPFILLFGHCSFMAAYAAYPKIDEIMIKPYYKKEAITEEPIFKDMG